MDEAKRKKLEDAGWKVGTVAEFLGLTPEESAEVEARVAAERSARREREGFDVMNWLREVRDAMHEETKGMSREEELAYFQRGAAEFERGQAERIGKPARERRTRPSAARMYAIVIERSDTGLSAYVPDLPGCVAAGETEYDVRELIREAIRLHLESMKADGLPVPEPSARVTYVGVPHAA